MSQQDIFDGFEREFEDFLRSKLGENVKIVSHSVATGIIQDKREESSDKDLPPPAPNSSTESGSKTEDVHPLDKLAAFDLTPRKIKEHLDRYVVKQDEAKKALAIAICDHYNRIKKELHAPFVDEIEFSKQNILLVGPTGVGKTYLIRQLAKLIGVPFVKADATRFTEAGFVGADVEDIIHDLVEQADGDVEVAQYGIVYLDEGDKLAASQNMGLRNASGRGVQFSFLKLLEDTEIDLNARNDMRSQIQMMMQAQRRGKLEKRRVSTRNILFIISGAFSGLDEIVKNRLDHSAIGFGARSQDRKSEKDDPTKLHLNYQTEDFVKYGFEPEFVGRLPIRVACETLDADDLFDVLTKSEGSILKQYVRDFDSYDMDLSFTSDALKAIATIASKEKTGARSLLTVLEKILRDYKFELPGTVVKSVKIDENAVRAPQVHLSSLLKKATAAKRTQKSKHSKNVTMQ